MRKLLYIMILLCGCENPVIPGTGIFPIESVTTRVNHEVSVEIQSWEDYEIFVELTSGEFWAFLLAGELPFEIEFIGIELHYTPHKTGSRNFSVVSSVDSVGFTIRALGKTDQSLKIRMRAYLFPGFGNELPSFRSLEPHCCNLRPDKLKGYGLGNYIRSLG